MPLNWTNNFDKKDYRSMGYPLVHRGRKNKFAESTLDTKSIRLQTEYIRTRRTQITVLGVSVDISVHRLPAYFEQYGEVETLLASVSKAEIATGEFVLYRTLTRKNFGEILNTLICLERIMLLIVAERHP